MTRDNRQEYQESEKLEMEKEIEKQQLRCYDHIMRLRDDKLIKQIVKWNPARTRKRFRSNIAWNEGV
jgi:hypothetical protein